MEENKYEISVDIKDSPYFKIASFGVKFISGVALGLMHNQGLDLPEPYYELALTSTLPIASGLRGVSKESLEKEVCKSLYENHHKSLENDLRQMGAEENKIKKSINDLKENA